MKPATTSISYTLLKIVFSLYLAIAILLTGVHLYTEYQNTQQRIVQSLKNIEEVVYKSLAITLWNYNIEAVTSIIDGLQKNAFLEGALITMPTGEKMGFGNIVQQNNGENKIYNISKGGELTEIKMNYFNSRFFGHDFPIYYLRDNGQKDLVGHMYVFSSHARVVSSVQSIFALIVFAAFIKTLALWFIFVWAIKTKLSAPLNSFTRFMDNLNIESKIYEPVDIHSSDRNELKLLEETFNSMLQKILSYQASLEEKENKLQHMNENLSQLVQHRTEQLDATNEDLLSQNQRLQTTLSELEETQQKLALTAHKAGMAEVSSGILHTVGTALNSVNIQNQSIIKIIDHSKLNSLMRANETFGHDFNEFRDNLKDKDKEEDLLKLYHSLAPKLEEEKSQLIELMHESNEKIHLMIATLKAQQKYAGESRLLEKIKIKDILLDSLMMTINEVDDIEFIINGSDDVELVTERNKLHNILVNLFLNARDSLVEEVNMRAKIIVRYHVENEFLYVLIEDNGGGIAAGDLTNIFNFGFSSRENHDGFGLHNSANHAREMGGDLTAKSNRDKKQTIFTLKLPLKKE